MSRLCLTDATIDAIRATTGRVIAGVMVPDNNRELKDHFSSLAIALDNGSYLHLFATSVDHASGEYFRLEAEPVRSLPSNFAKHEPVRWAIAQPLMRELAGTSIDQANVLQESMDDWGLVDVGVCFSTSSSKAITVRAEHSSLPMTLDVQVTS
jgi:hypothetical protein